MLQRQSLNVDSMFDMSEWGMNNNPVIRSKHGHHCTVISTSSPYFSLCTIIGRQKHKFQEMTTTTVQTWRTFTTGGGVLVNLHNDYS